MKTLRRSLIAIAGVAATCSPAAAQVARIDVTVSPVAQLGPSSSDRSGFTVCIGNATDRAVYGTAITPASGVVDQFSDVPAKAEVLITVNKGGYTGKDLTYTTRPGGNNHIEVSPQSGTGGPSCPTVSPPPPSQPPAPVATTISGVSALTQSAGAGLEVAGLLRPRVEVRDQNGNPMQGVSVAFTVTAGGGAIEPATVLTDAYGLARVTSWKLGTTPGTNTVSAKVSGLTPVIFTATGILVNYAVQAVTPISQQSAAGAPVPQPPGIIVRDQFNNPRQGVNVTYAVTAGGGSVSGTNLTTYADGTARLSSWTLGTNSGTNTVSATVAGFTPLTFTAISPFTLIAIVKRPDGVALANAYVCVGSRSSVDQYATLKATDNAGRAIFTLPAAPEYSVTAAKTGYVGQTAYQAVSGNSAATIQTLTSGSGGAACPGMPLEGTPSTAAPNEAVADLHLTLTQTSNPIIAGSSVAYRMRVHNRGAKTASGVVVMSTLPADLTYIDYAANAGFTCERSGTLVKCSNGSVAVGDSGSISIRMSLASTALSGHEIWFSAKADPNNTIAESNESNNAVTAVALTEAVIAPVVTYRLTTQAELTELFKLSASKGYQTVGTSSDSSGSCSLNGVPALHMEGPISIFFFPPTFTCSFDVFKRAQGFPPGWELRDVTWTLVGIDAWKYVRAINAGSGSPHFSVSFTAQPPSEMQFKTIELRGPAGMTWRDAFK